MMRLVKRGLMFGNLFEVTSPALVGRYNRALKHLTGRTTRLAEFHIDISGFSPEIGDEFDDLLYLNPDGFNRQFIFLSIEQRKSPLLNAQFSMSRTILKDYISRHEEQLFALTARNAVVGELINSAYSINTPLDLFSIRTIEIEADTIEAHVEASNILTNKITRFMNEPDSWWDDVLIADMIELSKRTGDITSNPIRLEEHALEQKNFYTDHFGGIYLFRDMQEPACIAVDKLDNPEDLPVEYACTLKDRFEIAAFLNINELVEPIVEAQGMQARAVLRQKLDFIVIDVAADKGEDLSNTSRRDLRRLKRKLYQDLPAEYHALEEVLMKNEAGHPPLRLRPDHPAYFYLLRSKNHRDKHLINMLLAQMAPLDFRQLFICHKTAFYSAYRSWSDAKREFVAQFLEDEYAVDKAGAREELFGPEPSMAEAEDAYDDDDWQGPWGPIPADR
ncbi:DUF6638 family protein [Cohaesibacter celericrescens]|uniref:Uncharacterized protein n=1 Tax=Cohaesibacter celericrescens TaxID=2067669 RepID=A0A2N5XUJ1_9HYPH|nr:DUF6638 family protein [Cohaesibacter celericrescens]PLW78127.1 hypothetical protein C0081_05620 [Cohaesibacter celericrescens]